MILLQGTTGRRSYREILRAVVNAGQPRAARGLKTWDAGMCVIELDHAYDALPLGVRPNLSKRVAAAEAIQLIGGFHNPNLMVAASPKFADFQEPTGLFHGAYGLRVGDQVADAIRKLHDDPDTRQAVITLWDPFLDNEKGKKDYPCTVALQFELEKATTLHMNVLMRSNDVWLGLPYDIFQFTQLQITVAHALRIRVGRYRHTTWSLHMYDTDREAAMNVVVETGLPEPTEAPQFLPLGVDCNGVDPVERFVYAMERANDLVNFPSYATNLTRSEEWYREHTAPKLG